MGFSFCRKCVQMTPDKPNVEFIVELIANGRATLLQKFDDFYKARDFARTSPTARVREHHAGKSCSLCRNEK